jgi:hypothetical protein
VLDAHAGFPVVYDGGEGPEADWHVTPTLLSLTGAAAGAGKTPSSTYTVAITYLWVDRWGNHWRSAPTVRPVTLGVGQNLINITVQTCRWTARNVVFIEVWCSQANAGFPLYREVRALNTTAADSVVTVAGSPDATIAVNETLDQFAPSNVLPHGTTQVTDYMAYVGGRFWSPDPQRADILRHTIERDISRDGLGWGWDDTQVVQFDTSVRSQAAGDLDGSLAMLAGNECHLLAGLGPDKQGAGLFGQPYKFGVVDLETSQPLLARVPDSAIPGGLAYATPRGLYILRRDRVSLPLAVQIDRLFRFDGVVPRTGSVVTLLQQTFSVVGPESRSLPLVNLPTNGHRVAWSQPPGDTGRLVITEIDSQIDPADIVICRTVTQL